jgi:hypothetical protein
MSDGWDSVRARHDQPNDDERTDTSLHGALIEAHRAVGEINIIRYDYETIAYGLW